MPRKTFVANEILTASDVNEFLMDQSVMVFAGTAARGSAIPSPTEGMVTYTSDDDEVQVYDGSVWKAVGPGQILQVVSAVKTDTFSTTSTSFVDVPSLGLNITPSSTSSKILVLANIGSAGLGVSIATVIFNIARGGTTIAQPGSGSAAGTFNFVPDDINNNSPGSMTFLDSPATTSSTNYRVRMRVTGGTGFVNRPSSTGDATTVSTITLMEVAG